MKLAEHQQQFKTNSAGVKSLDFGIGDPGIIIEILRNRLYGNKIQTIVQEYASNGRDAQREFNAKRPIEITFPTKHDLNFKVRDFGGGVSPERMADVFVLYGASTKRDTNTQTGGLGIGAKSGFAYSDSFTVTTFIDGVKRVYIAHLGAKNTGSMDLFSESDTTEDNGTEIQIAVRPRDVQEFGEAIVRATAFWIEEEYPIFHNAEDHQNELAEARKLGTARFMDTNVSGIYNNFTHTQTSIVIDGIIYPYPDISIKEKDEIISIGNSQCLNVLIPNGLVTISASREKVDDSDVSKEALKQIFIAALSDFKRAKEDWEKEIVDTGTMLKAKERMGGFNLSTERSYDHVRLNKGKFWLGLESCFDNPNYDNDSTLGENKQRVYEKLFAKNKLTEFKDRDSIINFDLFGENKYYMTNSNNLTQVDIRSWIYANGGVKIKCHDGVERNVREINLITILAQRETKKKVKNVDGTDGYIWKYTRNQELEAELIESVERLGFVNIDKLIPRKEKTKREKAAAKPQGKIMKVINLKQDLAVELSTLPSKQDQSKPWVYVICQKHSGEYERFVNKLNQLKSMKLVEDGYRVLERNRKHVEGDSRFTKIDDLIKNWQPSEEIILSVGVSNWQSANWAKYKGTFLSNIVEHLKDKNHILYKVAEKLNSKKNYNLNYELNRRAEQDPRIKDVAKGLTELFIFADKYLPLIVEHSHYNKDVKHIQDYILWGLDKAAKDNVYLMLPDILVKSNKSMN